MKRTVIIGKRSFQIDLGFIGILCLLCFVSCFSLYNAFNLVKTGTGFGYLLRQIFWYGIGFTTMYLLTSLQNEVIYKAMKIAYKYLMYALIYLFISRILASVIGHTLPLAPAINGAVSWFQIPLMGSFQPSEFMKIVLICLVSDTIQKHQKKYPNPTVKQDWTLIKQILKICLPPMILIFMQPDTGVFIIIGFTIFVLLACSGIRKEYVMAIIGVIVFAVALFFYLYFYQQDFLSSLFDAYRLQRIESWLNPDSYIQGSSNQLYTALLSLGSAGLTGYGLQAKIISIPEAHTDFIFAAIGQCFGLVGTTIIVCICMVLDLYLCKIAYNTKSTKNRLIVIGVVAMLFYQQIQNLGMIIGLLPITGITLPLISYGGSSILSYFISFAIIMNISPSISPSKKKTIHLKRPLRDN